MKKKYLYVVQTDYKHHLKMWKVAIERETPKTYILKERLEAFDFDILKRKSDKSLCFTPEAAISAYRHKIEKRLSENRIEHEKINTQITAFIKWEHDFNLKHKEG